MFSWILIQYLKTNYCWKKQNTTTPEEKLKTKCNLGRNHGEGERMNFTHLYDDSYNQPAWEDQLQVSGYQLLTTWPQWSIDSYAELCVFVSVVLQLTVGLYSIIHPRMVGYFTEDSQLQALQLPLPFFLPRCYLKLLCSFMFSRE